MSTSKFILANCAYILYITIISVIAVLTQQTQYEFVGIVAIFAVSVAVFVPTWNYVARQYQLRRAWGILLIAAHTPKAA